MNKVKLKNGKVFNLIDSTNTLMFSILKNKEDLTGVWNILTPDNFSYIFFDEETTPVTNLVLDEWNMTCRNSQYTLSFVLHEKTPEEITTSETQKLISWLDDDIAVNFVSLYDPWRDYIGKELKQGQRVQYNGFLYYVRQDINPVLQEYPPSIYTSALYEKISNIPNNNEIEELGTFQNPIEYSIDLKVFKGNFYKEEDVVYKCIRGSDTEPDMGVTLYAHAYDLIGMYFTLTTQEKYQSITDNTGDQTGSDSSANPEEPIEPDKPVEPDNPVISTDPDGSHDAPYPYIMTDPVYEGNYYIEDEKIYYCFRDSIVPLYNTCASLVNIYFTEDNNE